jgi:hypothetical protein
MCHLDIKSGQQKKIKYVDIVLLVGKKQITNYVEAFTKLKNAWLATRLSKQIKGFHQVLNKVGKWRNIFLPQSVQNF